MKRDFFPYLVFLAAIALAGTAAFFSVTGLSKLFAGSEMAVIVMASALEFAKVITAAFIHRYWDSLKWHMKMYLTIGVMTVMVITSAGIYGFLSNAYSITSGKMGTIQAQVDNLNGKKTIIQNEINALQQSKNLKTDRIKTLTSLRGQQETIMDSLYSRRQTSSAKRMQAEIEKSSNDIDKMNVQSDTLDSQVQRKYAESSNIDVQILTLQNSNSTSEVGPLKYIATLTGKSMDSVANFFILLLIFVFDPLAISLIIAANIAFEKAKNPDSEVKVSGSVNPIGDKVVGLFAKAIKLFKKKPPVVEDKISEIVKEEIPVTVEKNNIIEYMADEKGNFAPVIEEQKEESTVVEEVKITEPVIEKIVESNKATDELFQTLNVKHSTNFLNFLDILFDSGNRTIGSELPDYSIIINTLKANNINYDKKEIADFFTICNYFNITNMESTPKKITKDYEEAKDIFSGMLK